MSQKKREYSILDQIGNTPLVSIKNVFQKPGVRILAKLEYCNPGGSIKDRAALFMIEAGEKSGELTSDKRVIEATSGNTGIGLALVCAVKGYRLVLTMSEAASQERQKILRARGADILLTPGHLSTDGAIEEAYRLAREYPDKYFLTDQFNNPANWKAHYETTAVELWEQTSGEITKVVATLGTTGTVMGLQRRLKGFDPAIEIIGVEPYRGHKIQGLKNMMESYPPEIYEKERLDQNIKIDDDEAFAMTRRLASEEGLFVGMSSGAAMAVAVSQAREMESGTVVVILPDGGERYLSTNLFTVQTPAEITLYNTRAREKTVLDPVKPGKVALYVPGPTVNAPVKIGRLRRYLSADLLARYLKFRGYDVNQVTSITDYDDKTIEGSDFADEELTEYTDIYIDKFKNDIDELGVAPSDLYPRASEHLPDMVLLAEKLEEKGIAYEKLRSLYFDIGGFKEYGSLSGVDLAKIRVGHTVNMDGYEKDNPRDFTLLKRARLGELKRGIYLKTPWGSVRPSWHLQSATMALKHLGETFDIHAGSHDLIFPHHENVIAIAETVTGKPLANHWVHTERMYVDEHPNWEGPWGPTLAELTADGFSGREIRYWILATHYRKPLTLSLSGLHQARKALARIDAAIFSLQNLNSRGHSYGGLDQLLYDLKSGFTQAMDDDLNISAALASLFTAIRKINTVCQKEGLTALDAEKILARLKEINTVLNVIRFEDPAASSKVQLLIKEREEARRKKEWKTADRIREELSALNIRVRDQKMMES